MTCVSADTADTVKSGISTQSHKKPDTWTLSTKKKINKKVHMTLH